LAKDETASELVRITALQVCAARGLKDALPAALALADAAPTIPVQISAIAALGALGTAEQQSFLQDLAEGPEPRLRPAAQTALKRLQARLAQAKATPSRRN
jgi:HEAT repeat protein